MGVRYCKGAIDNSGHQYQAYCLAIVVMVCIDMLVMK